MKKFEIIRIVSGVIGAISLIIVLAISISGGTTSISDTSLLAMKIFGGIGIVALLVQAILSIARLLKHNNH